VTPPPSATRLAALVLVLAATPALARVAVLPLSGPRNHNLERQLTSTICSRMGCVPASTVMTGKRVDWDKVRRAKLEGIVVGGLSKATRPQVLEVSYLTPQGQRAWRERYTVVNGRISSATLVKIRDGILAAARPPAAAPGAAPVPAPAKPEAPKAAAPVAAAPAGEIAPPAAGEIAPPPAGEIAPPSAGAAAELEGPPRPELLEVEMALQLLHRSWTYSETEPANGFRGYSLGVFAEPRARVGIYPLRNAEGLIASFGLELAGAVAISTVLAGSDPAQPKFPLSLYWLDAGLRLRLRLGSWTLGPGLGFRLSHQSVSPNSQGDRIDCNAPGLTTPACIPGTDAKAVRMGLEAQGPIAGAFGATAEFSYLLVLSTGMESTQVPSPGAGPAFEGRVGATWQVSRPLRLALTGTFSQESYSLNVPGHASTARAASFGGELGFRLSL